MESSWLEWLYKKSVGFRAAITALSIVALVDYGFGWDRVNFLALVHAIVVIWDNLLGGFLEFPFRLIGVDIQIPMVTRHTAVLVAAFIAPALLSKPEFRELLTGIGRKKSITSLQDNFISVFMLVGVALLVITTSLGRTGAGFYAFNMITMSIMCAGIVWIEWPHAPRNYFKAILSGVIFLFTLEILRILPGLSSITEAIIEHSRTL